MVKKCNSCPLPAAHNISIVHSFIARSDCVRTAILASVSLSPLSPHCRCLLVAAVSSVFYHSVPALFQTLKPGANTTFDIVFLARQLGNVEHSLKIHTSHGTFIYNVSRCLHSLPWSPPPPFLFSCPPSLSPSLHAVCVSSRLLSADFQVFGVGTGNPYRLKPLIGARVPVNSSFSPVIKMHNPFSRSLRVVEMFSSGGNLHLELPTGASEASQLDWVTYHPTPLQH